MARNPLARPPPVRKTAAQVIVHTEIVDYLPLSNGTSRDVPPGFLLARSPADRMSPVIQQAGIHRTGAVFRETAVGWPAGP